jgi:hypothetical protein
LGFSTPQALTASSTNHRNGDTVVTSFFPKYVILCFNLCVFIVTRLHSVSIDDRHYKEMSQELLRYRDRTSIGVTDTTILPRLEAEQNERVFG